MSERNDFQCIFVEFMRYIDLLHRMHFVAFQENNSRGEAIIYFKLFSSLLYTKRYSTHFRHTWCRKKPFRALQCWMNQ